MTKSIVRRPYTFEDFCQKVISRSTSIYGKELKSSFNQLSYTDLGLESILSRKKYERERSDLRNCKDVYLKNIIRLLMIAEVRRKGSLDKVNAIRLSFVSSRKDFSLDVDQLPVIRKINHRAIDFSPRVPIRSSNLQVFERKLKTFTVTNGLFNVKIRSFFNYVNALNVDEVVIPIRDESGKVFEALIRSDDE